MDGEDNHSFSVELKSKKYVTSVSLSDKGREGVLFEGILGELEEIGMLEDAILFINGSHGTLRVDLAKEELIRGLSSVKARAFFYRFLGTLRESQSVTLKCLARKTICPTCTA
jgi:hypothetical protein